MRSADHRPGAAARRSRPTTRSAASGSCRPTAGTARSASRTSSSSPTACREVRAHSIVAADGVEREVDAIVFGTGFHVTDMPAAQRVRGRDGRLLDDVWHGSPRAHLGSTVAGFPNLFFLLGPNTGLGHSSMVYMIESQIAHVMDALRHDARARRRDDRGPAARRRTATTPSSSAGMRGHGLEHRLRELVPRRTRAATRRSGRTGRGASAAAPRGFDPTTTRSTSGRRAGHGGGMSARVLITGAAGGIGAAAVARAARARGARSSGSTSRRRRHHRVRRARPGVGRPRGGRGDRAARRARRADQQRRPRARRRAPARRPTRTRWRCSTST